MSKSVDNLETNLYVDNDIIPLVKNSTNIFLHKSTILYGSSGSGKTVLIKHILHLLKDIIPQIIIINPTNKLNHSYSNIVPKQVIYDEIDETLFKTIYDKQTMARQIYDQVQKIESMRKLFEKCSSTNDNNEYRQMINAYNTTKNNIDAKVKHISQRKSQQTQLREEHEKTIRLFFKQVIRKNKKNLLGSNDYNLTDNEKKIVKYLDYNPNLLLIFDDCAASFKNWGKLTGVNELFFNGRHFYVTTIMSFQYDNTLPPELRSNAFVSIFTTKQSALNFFENKKNGISKQDYKKFSKYIDEIFKYREGCNNHQKLCYFKHSANYNIQYILANIYEDFKFGSKSLWDFCEQVKRDNEEIDIHNPFYDRFNS